MLPINVLIIENDIHFAYWMKHAFVNSNDYEFQTTSAQSLDEALTAIAYLPFDLVILDLELPDSDGLSALSQIVLQLPFAAVVVISTSVDENVTQGLLNFGVLDYLIKPMVDIKTFHIILRLALRRFQLISELKAEIAKLKQYSSQYDWRLDENDTIIQSFFAADLVSTALPELRRRDKDQAEQYLANLENIVNDTLATIKTFTSEINEEIGCKA